MEFQRLIQGHVATPSARHRSAIWLATTALATLAAIAAAMPVRADDFQGLGFLPGGTGSEAHGVSADGSVVIGDSSATDYSSEAFRWTSSGGIVGLGFLQNGYVGYAQSVSADGSTVVGFGTPANFPAYGEAFRWTQSTGTVGLGFLLGSPNSVQNSDATGVNADGSVVVGYSTAYRIGEEAFRWTQSTGMVGLGFLPGGTASIAYGVSADGTVVVGANSVDDFGFNSEAFRWSQSGGMVGLGFLPGEGYSAAYAVSADGLVVVGASAATLVTNVQAFRWTQGGGMVGLGMLPGGTSSLASAVNNDGSVIVGVGTSSRGLGYEVFRWSAATGMQSLTGLLVADGVNMTGWTLSYAGGVSADGTVIVGDGTDPANATEAWLARFSPQFGDGMIMPGNVAQSFSGQSVVAQSGNAVIADSLGTMNEIAIQAYRSQDSHRTPFSMFAYGGYDNDPAASGTLGITVDLPDAMVAGAMAGATNIETDLVYGGSATMNGGSLGAFLARVPDAGPQWLLGVTGLTLSGDIHRGYLNGSAQTTSTGTTSASGYGATARLGWSFDNVLPATRVTPFASYTLSTLRLNGYTEGAGAFPAQFNGVSDTAQTLRFGADARYSFAPGKWVWGTLATAHKINNSQDERITGTLIGLFALTAPAAPIARDWIETTLGLRWPAWNGGALTASLTASIPANVATTYQARLGLTQTF